LIDNIIVMIRIMKSFELRKVMKIENKTAASTKLQPWFLYSSKIN
jgi:hypothetical protein